MVGPTDSNPWASRDFGFANARCQIEMGLSLVVLFPSVVVPFGPSRGVLLTFGAIDYDWVGYRSGGAVVAGRGVFEGYGHLIEVGGRVLATPLAGHSSAVLSH